MGDRLLTRGILLLAFGCLMLVLYWATFIDPFMPTSQGTLGHDHRGSLVEATIGYVHFQKSALTIPWFTPASCAGNMYIAGAANPYLNLQQWLTFLLDPLTASKINFLIFAGLGFVGTYLLCRRRFHSDTTMSLLGASLFMFNGFYAYRMIIGHTAFHAYMLVPLIALLLITRTTSSPVIVARNTLAAALLIAYTTLASGVYVLVTAGLALTGIIALHRMVSSRPAHLNDFMLTPWLPLAAAFTIAMLICAFKITLTLATASNFERDFYPLPGIPGLIDSVTLPLRLLFFSTPDWQTESGYLFTNYRWPIERHELEMGVGMPVLAILVFAAVTARKKLGSLLAENRFAAAVLLGAMIIPIALNHYQPAWNEFLKSVPVLRSFSLFVRLYAAYIPLVVLMTVLAFSNVSRYRTSLAILIGAMSIGSHWLIDRSYYEEQIYKPDVLLAFYDRFRQQPKDIPAVNATTELKYANFQGEAAIIQNEMFVFGSSNIECHNDMFGYRLEAFPQRELLIPNTSIFNESGGRLNFKNPSCYVFPDSNQCKPGDHFTADQAEVLEAFADYQGMRFHMPRYQWISNATSLVALLLVLSSLIILSAQRRKASGNSSET